LNDSEVNMLIALAMPEGYRLDAMDGEIGRCRDFLLDESQWAVRWMVADTGTWLPGRKVLVSPAQLDPPDWSARRLPVRLTREQIEQSPPLDADAPVSRRYEQSFNAFYALPHYWLGSGLWGDYPVPSSMIGASEMLIEPVPEAPDRAEPVVPEDDNRVWLRSVRELRGYAVLATRADGGGDPVDTRVGRVDDLIIDNTSWALHYVVVDRSWLPLSKRVLLPVELVDGIDWATRTVRTRAGAAQVKDAPGPDGDGPLSAHLAARVDEHYGHLRRGPSSAGSDDAAGGR